MSFLKHKQFCLQKYRAARARGFTMIELVVTMGIFALMLGVALSNYNQFSRGALFANDVEGFALSLREAQIYGTGVRAAGASFDVAYGVHIDITKPFEYSIFADKNRDGVYDTTQDEIISTTKFSSSAKIAGVLCDESSCSALDVTFRRPSPDARMRNNVNSEDSLYDDGVVTVSNDVKSSVITITRAGQISIDNN